MAVELQVVAMVGRATAAAERLGFRLGVLVNNAAQFVFADLTEATEDQWDRALGTNVKGYAQLIPQRLVFISDTCEHMT